MPAWAGSRLAGFSWSGHSGGCSFLFASRFDKWRTRLPWASKISIVISSLSHRLRLQVVVEDRALGRIVAHRPLAVHLVRKMQPCCSGGLVEVKFVIRDVCAGLAQRTNVVENPERAAMRRGDKVIVLHRQVVNRRGRQVELQRLPMCPVVDGEIHSGLRAGIEQSFDLWDLRAPSERRPQRECRY